LVMRAGHEQLAIVARRIDLTAREIHLERGGRPARYVVGAAAAENRRLDADELWLLADESLEAALEMAGAPVTRPRSWS
jgi:hypothetical protein